MWVAKQNMVHTGGNTHGYRLWGHRRLRLCRVLLARLVLIVTEVANLPLDTEGVCVRKVVVSIAFSAADHGVPEWERGGPGRDRGA